MKSLALLAALLSVQEPDVDALLRQLSDESIEVRDGAARALMKVGPQIEAKLRAKLDSSQGEVRKICESILARIEWTKRVNRVLPTLKRVTIDARDRKLKDVLGELREKTGMPIDMDGLDDVSVTAQVKDAVPLEAVIAVCKAAGLGHSISGPRREPGNQTPPNPDEFAVRFKPGEYADAPRQFFGPFLVECSRITLDRRTRFDFDSRMIRMSFKLEWPPGIRPDQAALDIAAVTDEKGGKIYEKPSYARHGGSDYGFPGQVAFMAPGGVEFRDPGEAVKKVTVKGSALILFAGEDRFIKFENPENSIGQKKELADMSVQLRGVKEASGMTTVTIEYTGRPRNPMSGRIVMGGLGSRFYQVRLEDGTVVECRNTGGRGQPQVQIMDLNFPNLPSKIAVVEILAETAYHEERFDFEFKDIPLPK